MGSIFSSRLLIHVDPTLYQDEILGKWGVWHNL